MYSQFARNTVRAIMHNSNTAPILWIEKIEGKRVSSRNDSDQGKAVAIRIILVWSLSAVKEECGSRHGLS